MIHQGLTRNPSSSPPSPWLGNSFPKGPKTLRPPSLLRENKRYSLGKTLTLAHELQQTPRGRESHAGTRASSCTTEIRRPAQREEETAFPKTTATARNSAPSAPGPHPARPPRPLSETPGQAGTPALPRAGAATGRDVTRAGGRSATTSQPRRPNGRRLPRQKTGPRLAPQGIQVRISTPGWKPAPGFSVFQSGFRFRAILCRKQYTDDVKASRRR